MDERHWQQLLRGRAGRRSVLRGGAVTSAGLVAAFAAACGGGKSNSANTGAGQAGAGQAAAGQTAAAVPTSAAKRGGTLVYRINDDPPSLNLWTEFTYIVAGAVAPAYNQLVQFDPLDESKVIPDLAKSWEFTNPDKTEIVFKLQDAAITWHDGKPFSADDVKATYDWLRSPPKGVTSQRTTAARNIDRVEVVDPKTVKFHLMEPSASLLPRMSNHHFATGAKHIIDQTNTLLTSDQQPVGTGPFVFKNYKRNNVMDFERNKSYWRPDRPYLDGITTYVLQEDTTALTNFLAGQIHILAPRIQDVDQVQKGLGDKGTLEFRPSLSRAALIPNGTKPPFNDPRMREALSAAVDREEFNKIRQQGKGFKGAYNNPKGQWALAEAELAKFSGYDGKADIQKAKQLMSAAGFGDGYKGVMPVRTDFEENAVAVQAMLKKAGLDFELQVEKSAVLTQRATNTDFDVLCHTWATPLDDPDDSFSEMLISPDRAGRNWSKITVPEVDRLYDLQRKEFDVAKRKQLSNDCDKAGLGAYPNIVIQYEPGIAAWYKSVRDFKPHVSIYTNQRYENVWLA